jgi:hypothetical protein
LTKWRTSRSISGQHTAVSAPPIRELSFSYRPGIDRVFRHRRDDLEQNFRHQLRRNVPRDSPFAKPDAAARKLLRIYREYLRNRPDISHTYTGVTNSQFICQSRGSVEEYVAGRNYGIAQKWFEIGGGGTRVSPA